MAHPADLSLKTMRSEIQRLQAAGRQMHELAMRCQPLLDASADLLARPVHSPFTPAQRGRRRRPGSLGRGKAGGRRQAGEPCAGARDPTPAAP